MSPTTHKQIPSEPGFEPQLRIHFANHSEGTTTSAQLFLPIKILMKLPSGQTPTILIVEDIDWIRSAMRRALEQHGFNVAEARDDLEALEIANHHAPDAILTEDSSPIFAALVERVREHPALRKVPIVIVNPDAEEGLRSDNAFVIKDYDRIEPLLIGPCD